MFISHFPHRRSRFQGRHWRALMLLPIVLGTSTASLAGPELPPPAFADPQRRVKLEQALPRIEALMAERMQDLKLPGLSYAVVLDGDVVLARALGLRDVVAGAPVGTDTVFRVASMTKSFTALAVLKLRDAGRLSLDDPVARHVPELARWRLPTRDSGPVTIRHLLAHTAGLPEDNPHGDRQLALTAEQFSAWLSEGPPFASAPGVAFEYSNLGYMILGRIVTKVSGQPFQSYIRDEILLPLGMRSTHWSLAAVPAGKLALGYREQGEGWAAEPMLEDGAGSAMGGLMTTPADLARFVAALMAAYPARDEAEQPPALRRTLREMQSGLGHPELWQGRRIPGGRSRAVATSYGFGLEASVDCAWGRQVEHSGGLPGFGSDMRWLPDHGVGIIVFSNLTYGAAGRLTREALLPLQATGALQPRTAAPSPALKRAADELGALAMEWNDERAQALAADNLFLDEPLPARRESFAKLREGLGRCEPGRLEAENALRGKLRMACVQGWLDIEFTLAPTQPPRVQYLDAVAGRPLAPPMQALASEVAAAVATGAQDLRLAPKAERAAIAAVLESTRVAYGSCKPGEVVDGDGQTKAGLKLVCDRGSLHLSLVAEQGRLARLSVRPLSDNSCLP